MIWSAFHPLGKRSFTCPLCSTTSGCCGRWRERLGGGSAGRWRVDGWWGREAWLEVEGMRCSVQMVRCALETCPVVLTTVTPVNWVFSVFVKRNQYLLTFFLRLPSPCVSVCLFLLRVFLFTHLGGNFRGIHKQFRSKCDIPGAI